MTDEQVINILAEKEDWRGKPNDYLTSKDALAPVLEKLSDVEWDRLHDTLYTLSGCDGLQQRRMARYCLMVPARFLAYAIAEAIVALKKMI